eukprot:TRINITY_DN41_c6_g1_i1.p1 TRINITY_DN41_c6_g1~~TRINITY_DN41_c6_g1_i1.p1  ORF type:complete len:550 (+),score=118.15 TRINITY_DN41_c6_g1_i1:39-1652(+)
MHKTGNETVVEVPPDTFLPITTKRLTNRLAALLKTSEEVNMWGEFVDNLRAVVTLNYDAVMNEVREVLDEFEAKPPEADDRQRYYTSMLENMQTLFDASQYTALAEETFTTAQEVEYEFDFPTSIDWDKLDASFLARSPQPDTDDEEWTELCKHLSVFTRGVKQTSKTGFFFPQKIELLLTLIQEWGQGTNKKSDKKEERISPSVKGMRRVVRNSLRDTCNRKGFMTTLFQRVEIKEPMFDKICMVYKNKPKPQSTAVKKTQHAVKKLATALRFRKKSVPEECEPLASASLIPTAVPLSAGTIEIGLFTEVPFGDLEAIFPHKTISLKKTDTVVFMVKIVSTIIILGLTVKNLFTTPVQGERVKGTMFLVLLLTIAVVKHAVALVTGWMNMKKSYERDVSNWTQVRTCATGMPVVAQLVDDVKEQELKEMVLAYFFLWQSSKATCTAEEIDHQVENFLYHCFDNKVDFDEDDGMQKLLHLGLVSSPSPDTYELLHTPESWIESHPHRPLTQTSIRTMPDRLRRISHSAALHPLFTSD